MPENIENQQWKVIHPALDFDQEHAYVGIKKHTLRGFITFLVRDDGELINCLNNDLIEHNIILVPSKCSQYPKWSNESIKAFENRELTATEPHQLFNDLRTLFTKYIDLQNQKFYDYLALWHIGTYFYQLFTSYPYVFLNGPAQSGKTKLLTLSSCVAFNGKFSLQMNPCGIFRIIEKSRCTLAIDELEEEFTGRMRNPEFRKMLLGGYKKGGFVQRMIRDEDTADYEPRDYATYSPKMLANIAGMDNVLESRCLTILMQRSANPVITRSQVDIDNPLFQQIRDKIFVFMMKNWKSIKRGYSETEVVQGIIGRDWELWQPIFVLANFCGGNILLDDMKTLAIEQIAERRLSNADTHENLLIETMLSIVTEDDYFRLSHIKEELGSHLENNGWLSEQYVARLLRRFGFTQRRRRNYGYEYFIETGKVRQLAQNLGLIAEREEGVPGEHLTEQPNDNQQTGDTQ